MEFIKDIQPSKEGPKKIALRMVQGAGYVTAAGVDFSKEHPYQLVDIEEVSGLLLTGRFEIADASEVRDFYNLQGGN